MGYSVLFILFVIVLILCFCKFRSMVNTGNDAGQATTEWCEADKALREYMDSDEFINGGHASYRVPATPEELLNDHEPQTVIEKLETDPKGRELLRRERETYIRFLETNPSLNRKDELISMLSNVKGDTELSNRIMKLLFK